MDIDYAILVDRIHVNLRSSVVPGGKSARFRLDSGKPLNATVITAVICASIEQWAMQANFSVCAEVRLPGLTRGNDYAAVVDYVIGRPASAPLAIEIDRGNKQWSLAKLDHALKIGYEGLWIKWGKPITVEIPKGIEVIYVPLSFIPKDERAVELR